MAETFDADPWLLNCPNGTVDLRTGKVKPHDPADYITKITACEVGDEFSTAPLFLQFMDTIFAKDKDLIAFVQRFLGYCLTGITKEHAFVFGYGSGQLLHHPVALDLVQIELDRCDRLGRRHISGSRPGIAIANRV